MGAASKSVGGTVRVEVVEEVWGLPAPVQQRSRWKYQKQVWEWKYQNRGGGWKYQKQVWGVEVPEQVWEWKYQNRCGSRSTRTGVVGWKYQKQVWKYQKQVCGWKY